jgi:hypothetical protein
MTTKKTGFEPGAIELSANIKTRVSPIELTFYIVTADQMDSYAESGLLADIFLALLGISSGAATGFWIAIKQGGLSPINEATLTTAMRASGVFVLVTLAFTVFFYWRQHKYKREWFTSQAEAEI